MWPAQSKRVNKAAIKKSKHWDQLSDIYTIRWQNEKCLNLKVTHCRCWKSEMETESTDSWGASVESKTEPALSTY